jgi:hypothetical protein
MSTEKTVTHSEEDFHLVMKTAEDVIELLYDTGIEPSLACAAAGVAFATGCFVNGKSLNTSIDLVTQFYNYTKQEAEKKNEANK